MQVESLTPSLEVVPGKPVIGRIRVVNDTSRDTSYQIRVVGIDEPTAWRPIAGGAVPAGTEVHVEVPILVPDLLGLGQHPVGIEVTSDQVGERPGLAAITVSVESVAHVLLRAEPSIVRGTTTGKFRLDIENREPTAVDLQLIGGANDVTAKFKPDRVRLQPGERAVSKGKVKGKRRWSGDSEQHFVTLTARGHASSQSITTRFVQRSMFPWRFRTLVAALVILAIWLAGAGVYVWYQRDRANDDKAREEARQEQIAQAEADAEAAGDGSAGSGSSAGTDGPGGTAGGAGGDAAGAGDAAFKTFTEFGGAVTLADGAEPASVKISLDEIPLGQASEGAAPVGFSGGSSTAKIWSARYAGSDQAGVSSFRQTDTVRSVDTSDTGTWKIANVALRRSYEVLFFKEGYDKQSFVVTPPEDGAPVEIDVEMQPAVGAIIGVVRDSGGGALGGVSLVASDGDLTFSTTSSTDPERLGEFSFNALSTPSIYSVTAALDGFGTEVVQFDLGPGEPLLGATISMRKGVGSIGGKVLARQSSNSTETGFGGVTITVTNGDYVRTVTSLTEGALAGTFSVPRVPIPGVYTVTASFDGYSDASTTVDLRGNSSSLQLRMSSELAVLRGRVIGADREPVKGAGVTLTSDDVSFSSNTFSDEGGAVPEAFAQFLISDGTAQLREQTAFDVPGEFLFSDLPPGTYRVEVIHAEHEPRSLDIQVAAGQFERIEDIQLVARERIVNTPGTLTAQAVDINDVDTPPTGLTEGVSFYLRRPGEPPPANTASGNQLCETGQSLVGCWLTPADSESLAVFTNLELGSYILRARAKDYRTKDARALVFLPQEGQPGPTGTVALRPFGNVRVQVLDSATGLDIGGFDFQLNEQRSDDLVAESIEGDCGGIECPPADPESVEDIVWSTGVTEKLADGLWQLDVKKQPPGYVIQSQELVVENASVPIETPMQFFVNRDSRPTINITLYANAFPSLRIHTYQPVPVTPTSSPPPEPLRTLDLTTKMACIDGNGDVLEFPAQGELLSGLPTGTYLIDRDVFDIHRIAFDNDLANLSGCKIVISGDDYSTAEATLDGPLQLGSSVTFDRQINMVVVPRAVTVKGRVFWFDGEQNIYLPGTPVVSLADVITEYIPIQTTDDAGGTIPLIPFAKYGPITADWHDLPAALDDPAAAYFTITDQIFDTGSYEISYPADATPTIAPGTIELTIPVGGQGPLSLPDPTTTALFSPDDPGSKSFDYDPGTNTYDYDVELRKPLPGVLQGCLTVETVRPDPNSSFNEIVGEIVANSRGISYTRDNATPVTRVADGVVADCADDVAGKLRRTGIQLLPAPAGVWSVDYVLPTGDHPSGDHPSDAWYQDDPNVPAPTPAERTIEPGATLDGFDRTLIENATINLQVNTLPPVDPEAPSPAFVPTYEIVPFDSQDWGDPADVEPGAGFDQSVEIRGLPVNASDPFAVVTQRLQLQIPNYDLAGATLSGDLATYDISSTPVTGGILANPIATDIAVGTRAGDELSVVVNVEPYGAIKGSIRGYEWRDDGIEVDDFHSQTGLTVQARLVEFENSIETTTAGNDMWIDVSTLEANDGDNSLDFEFAGESGYYEFRVVPSAPTDYKLDLNDQFLNVDFPVLPSPRSELIGGSMRVYQLENSKLHEIDPDTDGAFGLELKPATLDLDLWSVFDQDLGREVPLTGATMRVTRIDGTVNGTVISNGCCIVGNAASGTGTADWTLLGSNPDLLLQPGEYTLEIFDRTNNIDSVYPLTIRIDLPSEGLRIDAILPELDWGLVVTVKVVNDDYVDNPDDPNNIGIDVPPNVEITRTWTPPPAIVSGGGTTTLVPNSTPPLGDYTSDSRTTLGAAIEETLVFDLIPSGQHGITVTPPTGYTVYSQPTGTVLVPEVLDEKQTMVEVLLMVEDVAIDVLITNVSPDHYPGQTAQLYYDNQRVDDGVNVKVRLSTDTPTLIQLENVAPRALPYELRIDDELHAPNWNGGASPAVTFDVLIAPSSRQEVRTTMVADVARIEGALRLEDVPNACADPNTISTTCLLLPDAPPTIATLDGQPVVRVAQGLKFLQDYSADTATHPIVVSYGDQYTDLSVDIDVTLGQVTTYDVVLEKRAAIRITVQDQNGAVVPGAAVAASPAEVALVGSPVGKLWTIYVDPGFNVGFTVSATNYFGDAITAADYAVGATPPNQTVELRSREITVTVTPTDLPTTFTPTIDLAVPDPSPVYTATYTESDATAAVSENFPNTATLIPKEGTATATVTAEGYRDNTGSVPSATRVNFRQDINVDLHPLVSVSGTIGGLTGLTADFDVSLSNGVDTPFTTAVNHLDGTFAFDVPATLGDPDERLDIGSWNLSADVLGWGALDLDIEVTATTVQVGDDQPTAADSLDLPLALAPRTIEVDLDINRPNGDDENGLSREVYDAAGEPVDLTWNNPTLSFFEAGSLDYDLVIKKADRFPILIDLSIRTVSPVDGIFVLTTPPRTIFTAPDVEGEVTETDPKVDRTVTLRPGTCAAPAAAGSTIPVESNKKFKFDKAIFESVFDPLSWVFDPVLNAANPFCLSATTTSGTASTATLDIDISRTNAAGDMVVTAGTSFSDGITITLK